MFLRKPNYLFHVMVSMFQSLYLFSISIFEECTVKIPYYDFNEIYKRSLSADFDYIYTYTYCELKNVQQQKNN